MLRQDYGYDFERFWRSYPLKVNKGAAFKAFQKLKLTASDVDELVSHIDRRKKDDANWIEGKYVPHAATFLNGHRWEDEYKRVRQSAPSHREFQKEEEPRVVPTDEQIQERVRQLGDLRRMLH